MKKNVVKAMSVGLSAITLASSMSVTAFAEELPEAPATEIPVVSDDTATETKEQETKEITPVTDYVEEKAVGLTDVKEPKEGSVEEALSNAKSSLDDLAEETKDVEEANNTAEEKVDAAEQAEETASSEANEADDAATKALETVSNEDIAAAKTALEEANEAYENAETAVEESEEALQAAEEELNDLLKNNGLGEMTDEQLEEILAAIKNGTQTELINKLDGNTKEAIVAAKQAVDTAKAEAEAAASAQTAAKAKVEDLTNNDLLTKIALQKEKIKNSDNYWSEMDKLSELTYEYYLTKNVAGYVPGSVKFEFVKKDEKGKLKNKEFYTIATYEIKDEEGNKETVTAFINYIANDYNNKSSELTIKEKLINDVTDYDNVIKEAVKAEDAVYAYKDTQGNDLDANNVKAEVTVDGKTKVVVSKDTKAKTTNHLTHDNQKVDDKTRTSSFSIRNNEEKTVTTTDSVQFTKVSDAEKAFVEADANKAENQTVVLTVSYDGVFFDWSTSTSDVNGFEKWMTSVYKFFGSKKGLNYTITTTTVKPVVEVVETITADVVQTDSNTYESDEYWVTPFGEGAYSKAKKAAKAEKDNWEAQGKEYTAKYSISGWREWASYTITKIRTYIVNDVVVEERVYNGTSYTNTLVKEAVIGQDAEYGTKKEYKDGANIIATNDKAVADSVKSAKDELDAQKAIANNDKVVSDAKAKEEATVSKASAVVDAVKKVLTLKDTVIETSSQLNVIKGIIETAQENYDASVERRAAIDAAERERAARESESQSSSSSPAVVVPTNMVTTSVAANVVIADDAVPAAGPTRAARRNARVVAANTDTTAETTIEDEATPLAGDTAEVAEDKAEDTTVIADEATPLAATSEKSFLAKTWWGWLLLIIAAIAGGVTAAKKSTKKIKK